MEIKCIQYWVNALLQFQNKKIKNWILSNNNLVGSVTFNELCDFYHHWFYAKSSKINLMKSKNQLLYGIG